ncbi:hypothetical protein KSS87_013549 [Heliosperma pusillum]|nr:hypothetical protein KSS87_013549 [Heliosperma pusillum]
MSRILPLRLLNLSKSQAQFSPLFHLCATHGCSSTRDNGLSQNHMQLSKSRKIHYEHRNFSTSTELASKKCVPCNSKDIRSMSEELANELITKVYLLVSLFFKSTEFLFSVKKADVFETMYTPHLVNAFEIAAEMPAAFYVANNVPDWKLVNEGDKLKLSRSWKVKTFVKGLEFLQAIADVAEAEGHHPDVHLVGWNNVTIEIWTHSVGGLTENDFILAAKIDNLDLAHLLRIKPAK